MHAPGAFEGFRCLDCEADRTSTPDRCPDCGGPLEATYDDEGLDQAHERILAEYEPNAGLAQFAAALPISEDNLVTLSAGGTPLVDCPALAEEWGVGTVLLKDEARNPTGSLADREMAVAVGAARASGAETVALPSTGNGGQAAACYAARAGLASRTFVPSRCPFDNKAMINVHGGDMRVVGGRYPDALEAFEDARGDADWHSLAPFDGPYRQEGAKTIAYELVVAVDEPVDAVVHPTGHGIGLRGLHRGFTALAGTGSIGNSPRLYAAQPAGCAPIATAWETSAAHATGTRPDLEPVEHPDTIVGSLEIPAPAGGPAVLDALRATDGGAVAVPDDDLLEAGLELAQAGVPASATGGTALAGGRHLAREDEFDGDDTVVVVNPSTVNREADLLRSQLMKRGV